MKHSVMTAFVGMAVLAGACSDSEQSTPDDDRPAVAAVCAEDTPDCDDIVVVSPGEDPGLDGGDSPISPAGGLLVDGGLTIPEALATDATGVLAVKGNLFDDGTGVRLCETLAESFPPQCGGARLEVAGFGFDQIGQLSDAEGISVSSAQGVTWTDGYVSLLGELEGDVLTVSSNSI